MENIYVIECSDEYIYVTSAIGLTKNLIEYFSNLDCNWIKMHRPKEVIDIIKNKSLHRVDFYVLEYMNKYCIKKVRGGSYENTILTVEQLDKLNNLLLSDEKQCKYCKSNNHVMPNCTELKSQSHNFIKNIELVKGYNLNGSTTVEKKQKKYEPTKEKIVFTIKSIKFTFEDNIKDIELFFNEIEQLTINKSITDFNGFSLNRENDCFWPISKLLYNNFKDDFKFLPVDEELNFEHSVKARLVLREIICAKMLQYIKYYCIYKFSKLIQEETNSIIIDEQSNTWSFWTYRGFNPKKYTLYDFVMESFDNINCDRLISTVQNIIYINQNKRNTVTHNFVDYDVDYRKMCTYESIIKNTITNINNNNVDIIVKNIHDYKIFLENDEIINYFK